MADSSARLGATQELCAWGLSELGGGEVCTRVEVVWVRLYQSFKVDFKVTTLGTFLAVQWLRLHFNAGGVASIPPEGTKILHAMWPQGGKKSRP